MLIILLKALETFRKVRSTDKSMEVEDHCCQRMSTSQCSQQGYIYMKYAGLIQDFSEDDSSLLFGQFLQNTYM